MTVAGSYYPGSEVRRRAQAFVNGGFTVFAAGGVLPAMTIGAGMDWWAKPRTGLRVEVRAQLPSMMTVRCGVVFR